MYIPGLPDMYYVYVHSYSVLRPVHIALVLWGVAIQQQTNHLYFCHKLMCVFYYYYVPINVYK